MAATTTLLGLVTPTQGTLSGTWGDTVNYGISDYVDISVAGTLTLTNDGAVTLANTTGSSSGNSITSSLTGAGTVTAQFAIVRVTGTLTVAKVVTGPSYSKTYTVVNAATGGIVTFKASGQTGVSVAVGESAFVYFNGTDYVKVSGTVAVASFQTSLGGLTPSTATTGVVTLAGTLNTTSGGTGLTSFTAGDVPYYASGSVLSKLAIGTAGQFLTSTGTAPQWSTLSGVAVTTFSAGTTGFTPNTATSGAVTLAGTLATTNGGTGLTSFTSGGVVYASSGSALATGSALTFDGTNILTTGSILLGGVSSTGTAGEIGLGNAKAIRFRNAANSAFLNAMYVDASNNLQLGAGTFDAIFSVTGLGEAMRIVSTTGNVGIGTSSPALGGGRAYSKVLTIDGGTNTGIENTGALEVGSSTNVNDRLVGGITFFNRDNSGSGGSTRQQVGLIEAKCVTSNSNVNDDSGGTLVFLTKAEAGFVTEKMRLDSTGNLGLAVTPSAWSSSWKALDINTGGAGLTSSQENCYLTTNAYNNAGWKYKFTTVYGVSWYEQFNGQHAWYSAASGTAGNAISATQAMTLFSDGNFTIGDTNSGSRLNVVTTAATITTMKSTAANGGYLTFSNGSTVPLYIGFGSTLVTGVSTSDAALRYSDNLIFSNGATERVRIASAGQIGLSGANYGTSGQVLTSGGSGGAVSWTTPSGGGSSATPTVEGTVYGRTGSTGYNAALGYNAMATTPVGGDNVAVGAYSLQVNTAADVTAVGSYALNANTSGTANVGVGRLALYANTTGAYNVAVGHSALKANTTADANTAVGYQAAFTSTTATRITAVGMNSLLVNTVTDNTAVGYATLQANTTGANNVAVGCQEASGYPAMYSNTTGGSNTAFGAGALSRNTTASENTAVGHQAAYLNTTGAYNTAIGTSALKANTTASKNTAVGYVALTSNTTGANNVAVGDNNFYANTTGSNNTSIGCEAAKGITTGSNHIAFGYRAGQSLTTANNTICIGASSAGSAVTGNGILHIATGGSTASSSSAYNEMVICCDSATGKGSVTGFINPQGGGVYQGNNSSTWSTTSDRRLKKNIVDNNVGLEKLSQIQVRNFEYRVESEITELPQDQAIQKTGVQLGVIAQELQAVLPDCVKTESTGVLSVDPDNLIWYAINAIKELKAQNDSLKARLDAANL